MVHAGVWAASSAAGALATIGFALWLKGLGDPWISFAGGVVGGAVGGAMTLAAGAIAFKLTRRQVEIQETELRELKAERTHHAASIVALVGHTSGVIELATKKAADEITKHAKVRAHTGVLIPNPLPSFRDVLGYHEMWRISPEAIIRIASIDLTVGSFNEVRMVVTVDPDDITKTRLEYCELILSLCAEVRGLIGQD